MGLIGSPDVERHLGDLGHEAMSPVAVAIDEELVGTLAYADPIRPESASVIERLREKGFVTSLC
jgi:Cu+-exporting ATPase